MNNDGILHMDEKTPHIHATIVPIVTGERRKAKKEEQNGKKKYRKKSTQGSNPGFVPCSRRLSMDARKREHGFYQL